MVSTQHKSRAETAGMDPENAPEVRTWEVVRRWLLNSSRACAAKFTTIPLVVWNAHIWEEFGVLKGFPDYLLVILLDFSTWTRSSVQGSKCWHRSCHDLIQSGFATGWSSEEHYSQIQNSYFQIHLDFTTCLLWHSSTVPLTFGVISSFTFSSIYKLNCAEMQASLSQSKHPKVLYNKQEMQTACWASSGAFTFQQSYVSLPEWK